MATVIRKAVIRGYDATSHRAAVQIAGSLGVWLDAIRVATGIPAADVVAGRQCTVLFLDPANQDDAVVLTIQGALPSGGGGGVTDHGALTGLADDDHPQYGALAQAETVAALWTFGAGLQLAAAQAVKDSGGTDRITLATTAAPGPNVILAGGVQAGDRFAVNTVPTDGKMVQVFTPATYAGAAMDIGNFTTNGFIVSANPFSGRGLAGQMVPQPSAATTGHLIKGLEFLCAPTGGGAGCVVASCEGINIRTGAVFFTGTITDLRGIHIVAPNIQFGAPVITTQAGIYIENMGHRATIVDAYGLKIDNMTLNTGFRRLIEALGLTGPNLRVEAGDPTNPGAGFGRAQVLMDFNENGAINIRRVEWEDFATLAAGDKVLKAV